MVDLQAEFTHDKSYEPKDGLSLRLPLHHFAGAGVITLVDNFW